jgi:hypothetical protein
MNDSVDKQKPGAQEKEPGLSSTVDPFLRPMSVFTRESEVCCGPPAGPRAGRMERPGYLIWPFVEEFIETNAGPVPRVKRSLGFADRVQALAARLGIARNSHRVAPGLYCTGEPMENSPVFVTANYKLSTDALRKELSGIDAWILVLDTLGINVWCAASKGTFCAEEIAFQVKRSGLEKVVAHRKLVLPQLSATGVSAPEVRERCGFSVVWGPVYAKDIKEFLGKGMHASSSMRAVTFSFSQRLVLVPVEISGLIRPALWVFLALFILSGIGPGVFSLGLAWSRSPGILLACLAGIAAGAVLTPLFLPWIPWRAFAAKGAAMGFLAGAGLVFLRSQRVPGLETISMIFAASVLGSYLAMNFTGATPFTSPSGVEKEMRKAIPIQAVFGVVALALWIASSFYGKHLP